jgi:recombination protein RecA
LSEAPPRTPARAPPESYAVRVNEDQEKSLELALAHLEKQYGKGTVMRLGSESVEPWPAISTGSISLNTALGIGGLPRGRIIEIYGPMGTGKSTVCLSIIAVAQKEGLTCAYVDAEHALDPVYMDALGVNLDELLLAQPSNGEEALEIVDILVGTGAVGVVVIDSVAALTPKAELEGSMEDSQMGLQARLMAKGLRKITAKAAENKVCVIFTNQIREKMSPYGNPEVTPGGRSLGFYASVRLELRKKEDIKAKDDGSFTGIRVKAKIVKNKLAPPLKLTEFDVIYGQGINSMGDLIDHALHLGVLKQSSGWVKWSNSDETVARSREAAVELLKQDPAFAKTLEAAMQAHVSDV